jgi:hypothetical protein
VSNVKALSKGFETFLLADADSKLRDGGFHMRNRRLGFLLVVVAVIACFSGILALTQGITSGTVQGRITRVGTSEPIADVLVTVSFPSGQDTSAVAAQEDSLRSSTTSNEQKYSAVSASDGTFRIENVRAGPVVVRAQRQGYFGSPYAGVSTTAVVKNVRVLAQRVAEITVELIPGATVTGRVTDSGGNELSDVIVRAFRRTYRNDGTSLLETTGEQKSDDRAQYRLYRLPPGEYYFGASFPASNPTDASRIGREIRVPTFYPNATDIAAATRIVLSGGEEIHGIDIRVRTKSGVRVSGTVTNNLPAQAVIRPETSIFGARGSVRPSIANLTLLPLDALEEGGGIINLIANTDGTFRVQDVLPGTYDLIARLPASYGWNAFNPPGLSVAAFAFGRTRLEVGNSDLENVRVIVQPGFDIKGVITVDGRPTPAAVRVSLQSNDIAAKAGLLAQALQQLRAFQAVIQPDGSFTIPVVPEGRYRFQVVPGSPTRPTQAPGGGRSEAPQESLIALPNNAYLADIRQGSTSIYADGLSISGNTDPVEIVLRTDAGSIAGSVFRSTQVPAESATIVLVPSGNRRTNPDLYQVTRSNQDGQFLLTSVPPGVYKLFAWENVQTGAYKNSEFIAKWERSGVEVSVSARERVNATASLILEGNR